MTLISRLKQNRERLGIWFFLVISFLCLFLLVGGVIFLNEKKVAAQHAKTDEDWSLIVPAITPQDHVIGDLSAPIQLVVYADFECPYCKSLFGDEIPRLQAQFENKIVVAYRHFPLRSQPGTQIEAEASECVSSLGGEKAFWRFANAMFLLSESADHSSSNTLKNLARGSGVDTTAFGACLQQKGMEAKVNAQRLQGSIAGIDTTPSEVLKSSNRALVVKGEYYSQLYAGIEYLLDATSHKDSQ